MDRATLLFLTGVALLVIGALSWMEAGGNSDYDDSFTHAMWLSWGVFFDPGIHTYQPNPYPNISITLITLKHSLGSFIRGEHTHYTLYRRSIIIHLLALLFFLLLLQTNQSIL